MPQTQIAPAGTASAFTGVLNSNEIYEALFNLKILFQRIVPQSVMRDPVISLIEKGVGNYGDQGVFQGCDITGTYDFLRDAEASKLLAVNRNETQKIEKYVIDQWRMTDITVDAYISRRAFLDEGTFAMFNGYLIGTLSKNFDAYETGSVKSSLGTYTSPIEACTIEVTMPAADGTEATERIRAAKIKKALLDLEADMKDNQRKYNGYGFYASYNMKDFSTIWSSKYVNEINALAMYSTFNPEFIKAATEGMIWTPKWFGNVYTSGNTTNALNNTTSYSLIEQNSDGTDNLVLTAEQKAANVYRIFPGDLLPNGFTYEAYEAYRKDDSVICKIIAPEYIGYMTGYQQGEAFHNPRSSTDNHYLRKGFSPIKISLFRPYITLKEVNPAPAEE